MIPMVKESLENFMKKALQKNNQKEFRSEKVIKGKADKLYLKWKGYDNSLNVWIDKKDLVCLYHIKMSQYFPKPFRSFRRNVNVKVDFSNYATKADFKNISYVDTSSFALKTNLANLKTEVDKLDINKLVPVPVDSRRLSDVVKNNVVKKTDYNAKITKIENKIPNISNLETKIALNTVENKIPDVSKFATKAALTNLSNTVPDISTLIKKSDYGKKNMLVNC